MSNIHHLNHKHLIVTAFVENPPKEAEPIKKWLAELVDLVNMKTLMGPYSIRCNTHGNEGVTGVVVIETSHCSMHSFETEKPFIKFDLYSCDDFSVDAVLKHLNRFGLISTEHILIDRNDKSEDGKPVKSMTVLEHEFRTYGE